MGFFRIYTGEDDKSYLRELSWQDPLWQCASHRTFFKEFKAGTYIDWHPSPRRQIVTIISGKMKQHFGDGTVHTFQPGDVRLIEDTTGEGHTTEVIGEESALLLVVSLEADKPS